MEESNSTDTGQALSKQPTNGEKPASLPPSGGAAEPATVSEPLTPSRCIACREIIRGDARLCPHCGTSQQPQRWRAIGQFLKWVGGTTAVITLVASSLQLGGLYQQWQKRERVVDEYVDLARLLHYTGDPEGAQHLLTRAEELDPGSGAVQAFQADLIMHKLREYYASDSNAVWVATYKLYEDEGGQENYDWRSNRTSKRAYLRELFEQQEAATKLALALIGANEEKKAEILAHMAWLETLVRGTRERHNIEALFKRAIKADADNAYACVMYAGWLMEYYNFEEAPQAKLSAAISLMEQARTSDAERRWFNALRVRILSSRLDELPQSGIELLKVVAALDPADLTPSMVADSLGSIADFMPPIQDDGALADNPMRGVLRSAIPDRTLANLVERLGARGFGCSPWRYSCDPQIDVTITFDFFEAAASLYEQIGQQQKATQAYLMAWLARRRANWDVEAPLLAAIQRNLDASGTSAAYVPVVVEAFRDGGFAVGDLITKLNGINVRRDLRGQYGEGDDDATYVVTVVRNGEVLELETQGYPHRFVRLTDYVVPVSFLSDGQTPPTFAEMHRAWTSQ